VITGCSKWPIFSPTQPRRLFSPATLRVHGTRYPGTRLFLSKAAVSEKARRSRCSYVGTLSETRTNPGPGHVSACQGWAGETSDIFNILLGWAS
jgi:hypothetical protein